MAVFRTQTEEKVFNLINERLGSLGFNIVRIRNLSMGKKKNLQIMIEKTDETNITIDNCEQVSKHISVLLDIENIMSAEYNLEISSPGLNRPLTKLDDFHKFKGNIVKFNTFEAIDGRRKFYGKIAKTDSEEITFELTDPPTTVLVNYNNIDEAFLQYFDSNINSTANYKGSRKK